MPHRGVKRAISPHMRLDWPGHLPRLGVICLVVSALSAIGCANSSKNNKPKDPPVAKGKTFSLFVTTELRGTIEPCGCNSDPLGDLARTTQLITQLRKSHPVLHIDGGSALYQTTSAIPERLNAQEQLKAAMLQNSLAKTIKTTAMGLGPYDLASGAKAIKRPRHAANITEAGGVPVAPPEIVDANGVKVGIFGVIEDSAAYKRHGIKVGPPLAAAKKAITDLRTKGAQVIVGLLHMARSAAIKLARKAKGMDFVVVGRQAPEPDLISNGPRKVGTTWVVQPANRGQIVTRLDISVRADGTFVDAVGDVRAKQLVSQLTEQVAKLKNKLVVWKEGNSSDPYFVKTKETELAEMTKKLNGLRKNPLQIPAKGNYFVMQQVKIRKALPCNAELQQAKLAFDKAAGAANVKAAKNYKPDKPAKGKPGYVGVEECGSCHRKAVNFWKKTRHYQAWKTLEVVGKQFNYDCTSCHVTGWDKPGGATMGYNDKLRAVQCETCHGPGSIHVDEDGKEKPRSLRAEPPPTLCKTCHNKEHSDTFDYKAYLRDVTGPGHGESFRNRLGKGVTGHELRSAALKKAGAKIGAGCPK